MHKILSLAYVLIIVSFGVIDLQFYLGGLQGAFQHENLFYIYVISFPIASGLVGYLHYKIYRTPQRLGVLVGAFFLISLLNVLLSLSVVVLYFFANNHGDIVMLMGWMLMAVTLFLSVILAIVLLIKSRLRNTQP